MSLGQGRDSAQGADSAASLSRSTPSEQSGRTTELGRKRVSVVSVCVCVCDGRMQVTRTQAVHWFQTLEPYFLGSNPAQVPKLPP